MVKKGESGIGTLVLFLAFILVAAIAAGVLLQTSTSLQNKATTTNTQGIKQLSNSVQITQVAYRDYSAFGSKGLIISMKLVPGSSPLNVSTARIQLFAKNWSYVYPNFGSTYFNGEPLNCFPSGAQLQFIRGNTSISRGLLREGEVLSVCVETLSFYGTGILEGDEFTVEIISPQIHVIKTFTAPPTFTDEITIIYP